MISGEAKDMDMDVEGEVVVSSKALKDLQKAVEDRWYWKGRADGLEYVIDTLQSVFEIISKER